MKNRAPSGSHFLVSKVPRKGGTGAGRLVFIKHVMGASSRTLNHDRRKLLDFISTHNNESFSDYLSLDLFIDRFMISSWNIL